MTIGVLVCLTTVLIALREFALMKLLGLILLILLETSTSMWSVLAEVFATVTMVNVHASMVMMAKLANVPLAPMTALDTVLASMLRT
jgi:hypothetical protein